MRRLIHYRFPSPWRPPLDSDARIPPPAPTTPSKARTDGLQQRIAAFAERVAGLRRAGHYHYFQPVQALDDAWVQTPDGRKLMLATYNYLGLLGHPDIAAAVERATRHYGSGTHGVRIFGGTLDLHRQLEERIAGFFGREDAIVYSSGYVTNLATVSTLVGRGDRVLGDRLNHASIVDGCTLSGADFRRYRHNDPAHLEGLLQRSPPGADTLVVADAVFSMDGDILNLPAVLDLCRRYNALLMVDEAHSLGVLGASGRGIEEHWGQPGRIPVLMGTLSKTIPAMGGYVTGERDLIAYLRHNARGFVFSAAMTPPVAAAALAAFDLLEREGTQRRARLAANVDRFSRGLRDAGFDLGPTQTPVIPVMLGDSTRALALAACCQARGLLILPVLPPAVPEGTARLRVNVTAAHTSADVDLAVDIISACGRDLGLPA